MARRSWSLAAWMLSGALTMGCDLLGGQTGQPTAANLDCKHDGRAIPLDGVWRGVPVAELAHAFDGTHSAPLVWHSASPSNTAGAAPEASGVVVIDSVSITVSYEGADVSEGECGVVVPVQVHVTTSKGLEASQVATIEVKADARPLQGELRVTSGELTLGATLYEAASGVSPSGSLRSLAPGGEQEFATFPQ